VKGIDDLALHRLALRADRRRKAESDWRMGIVEARGNGHSLRRIGLVARVSHVRVLQILREEGFANSGWQ
jgi:hypothetical protein